MRKDLEHELTGRKTSAFAEDVAIKSKQLKEKIGKASIAVIGAAGSIGFSVLKELLRYSPKEIVLFDISENNLVEVIRQVRSENELKVSTELTSMSIGLGSKEFDLYFQSRASDFDYILNLSALKHVRSERDVFSLRRMIKTNVLFPHFFLKKYSRNFKSFFSVSTDKAANPTNLMGASKALMENMMLLKSSELSVHSARFANVAFSDGSLPYGFFNRITKKQILAGPSDIKRYFISHEEAGQLCLLSSFAGENGDILIPEIDLSNAEMGFKTIAEIVLSSNGYKAVFFDSEDEARESFNSNLALGKWNCVFTPSESSGEKSLEEFLGQGETKRIFCESSAISAVTKSLNPDYEKKFEDFVRWFNSSENDDSVPKNEFVSRISALTENFSHIEKGKSLDSKI